MPVERGCGTKKAGVYLEVGTSPNGVPIEWFLYDPPKAPEELGLPHVLSEELANKTRTIQAGDVHHVLRWVGAQHYPFVADIIEEGRRHGLSFRIPPDFPVETLTQGESSILVAHPFCYNDEWEEQSIPKCSSLQEALRHPRNPFWQQMAERTMPHEQIAIDTETGLLHPVGGPCLWKTYQLIPEEAGTRVESFGGSERVCCLRTLGKTEYGASYTYYPTAESTEGLRAGFFGRFPISWVTFFNGAMGGEEREKWEEKQQRAREAGLVVRRVHMEHDPESGLDVEVEEEREE